MKSPILFTLFIFIISCGQSTKETPKEEKVNKVVTAKPQTPIEEKIKLIDTMSFNDLVGYSDIPDTITNLTIRSSNVKHLPSKLGLLKNIKTLKIFCMENLTELPVEIGQLKNLEILDLNNGNGCVMNVLIPKSIGQLQNLKELILYGALDAPYFARMDSIDNTINPQSINKKIPEEIGQLANLEILDLGRNRIDYFPPQIKNLTKLRILRFEYSNIKEIPSFISSLRYLEEIDIRMNGRVVLPNSLSEFKNLKILMGDCELSLKDQAELKKRFPNIIFDFENEYVQGSNEQETR